jgi:hypothetical protein
VSALTHVELFWLKHHIENRIRSGALAEQHFLDRTREVGRFGPYLRPYLGLDLRSGVQAGN